MQINRKYIIIIALLVVILGGIIFVSSFYHSYQRTDLPEFSGKNTEISKNLEEVNKFLVQKDAERIQSFVRRRGWDMKKTGSGLWYTVYEQGEGPEIKQGSYVKIDFEIRLLDGTLCYSSDSTGAKIFRVGMAEEVTGLHEGLKLLDKGDKARMIMPPYLAHGLLGDTEKIPARSILVYDLTVQDVSDEKIQH